MTRRWQHQPEKKRNKKELDYQDKTKLLGEVAASKAKPWRYSFETTTKHGWRWIGTELQRHSVKRCSRRVTSYLACWWGLDRRRRKEHAIDNMNNPVAGSQVDLPSCLQDLGTVLWRNLQQCLLKRKLKPERNYRRWATTWSHLQLRLIVYTEKDFYQ